MQPLIESILPRSRRAADVTKGLARQFAIRKNLPVLLSDEFALFETFSAYCVGSKYRPQLKRRSDEEQADGFDPDDLRKGEPGGGDLGIDAYAVIINRRLCTSSEEVRAELNAAASVDAHFILVQAKRQPKPAGKVFTELASTIQNIFSDEELIKPHRRNAQNLRECVEEVYKDYSKFQGVGLPQLSVWYTCLGTVGPNSLSSKRKHAKTRLERMKRFRSPVSVEVVGAHQLREMYREAESMASVSITMSSQAELPEVVGGVKRAVFGIVLAKHLVDNLLHDPATGRRREYLYQSNLREYLRDSTSVNAQIAKTLQDASLRPYFAAMNNGITILTSEILGGGDAGGVGTLLLTDPQVVNGCQTCNVLLDNREYLDDSVLVSVRVIQSANVRMKRKIVDSTNLQTAIPPTAADAFNDAHMNLEDFFFSQEDESRQLLYERRLKQYGVVEDPSRVVTRRDLTQAYASMWLDEAYRASRVAVLEDVYKEHLYQDGDDELPYYAAAAVLNRIVWLFGRKEIPRAYWTARFHLTAGVKLFVAGDVPLPKKKDDDMARVCQPIIDAIWSPDAKDLIHAILPALRDALGPGADARELGQLVRNMQFGERFREAVLRLPRPRR